MSPEPIREALDAMPFQPFHVELASGKSILVKHTDYAVLGPGGSRMIVFTNDSDAMELIDTSLITNLSYGSKKGAKRR